VLDEPDELLGELSDFAEDEPSDLPSDLPPFDEGAVEPDELLRLSVR